MSPIRLPSYFTPHTLRHTHVSLLAEAGDKFEVIADRLGHKGDKMTSAIYHHVTKAVKHDSADKFAALMQTVSKTLTDHESASLGKTRFLL